MSGEFYDSLCRRYTDIEIIGESADGRGYMARVLCHFKATPGGFLRKACPAGPPRECTFRKEGGRWFSYPSARHVGAALGAELEVALRAWRWKQEKAKA